MPHLFINTKVIKTGTYFVNENTFAFSLSSSRGFIVGYIRSAEDKVRIVVDVTCVVRMYRTLQ